MSARRARQAAAYAGVCALAVLAGHSALSAAAVPAVITLPTGGKVTAIAADGGRVAIAVAATRTSCDRVLVWQPARRALNRFDAGTNCPRGERSLGEGIVEVGFAGTKAAWVERRLGNHQYLTLRARTLGQPHAKTLADVENFDGAEGDVDGDYVGNLHGNGSLLAYNTWTICTAYPEGWEVDAPKCDEPATGDQPVEVVRDQALWKAGNARPTATGAQAYAIVAVGRGLVVTRQPAGFTVIDSRGRTVSSIAAASPTGVAFDGNQLAVQSGDTVQLYDARTGESVATLRTGSVGALADMAGGVLVFRTGAGGINVLSGGRAATLPLPRGARLADVELEPEGLYVAYNVSGKLPGRVVFRPLAAVRAL